MPMPRKPLPRWRWMGTDPRARAEHPGTRFYIHVHVYIHNNLPQRDQYVLFSEVMCPLGMDLAPGLSEGGRMALWLGNSWVPLLPQRWLWSIPTCRSKESVYPMARVSSEDSALSYTANSWLQRGSVLGAANWQLQ